MPCIHMLEGSNFQFTGTNTLFNVKYDMCCTVKCVVYALVCMGCGKQYIGQTTDLRARLTLHRQHINNEEYCHLPVSKHIRKCALSLNPSFKVFPFYKVLDGNQATLDVKETFFINKYKPCLNGYHRP